MNRFNRIIENKIFIENYNKIIEFEKGRKYCKHNLDHLISVARIMYIKVLEDNSGIDKDIIYAIALLHDIGRSFEYDGKMDHREGSKILASQILKDCDYSDFEISEIVKAIESHKSIDEIYLNKLLRFADRVSRNCFYCSASDTCKWDEERKNKGIEI